MMSQTCAFHGVPQLTKVSKLGYEKQVIDVTKFILVFQRF